MKIQLETHYQDTDRLSFIIGHPYLLKIVLIKLSDASIKGHL